MKGILREKWNSESGSAQIIEMTLIFPIVLFVLGFLIYVGSYVLQSTAMYTEAQKIAVIAAREGQMPGYENFFAGTGITTKTDFDWSDGYMPGKDIINEVMKVHDPYSGAFQEAVYHVHREVLLLRDGRGLARPAGPQLCDGVRGGPVRDGRQGRDQKDQVYL